VSVRPSVFLFYFRSHLMKLNVASSRSLSNLIWFPLVHLKMQLVFSAWFVDSTAISVKVIRIADMYLNKGHSFT
jgi:hypothetical protein